MFSVCTLGRCLAINCSKVAFSASRSVRRELFSTLRVDISSCNVEMVLSRVAISSSKVVIYSVSSKAWGLDVNHQISIFSLTLPTMPEVTSRYLIPHLPLFLTAHLAILLVIWLIDVAWAREDDVRKDMTCAGRINLI